MFILIEFMFAVYIHNIDNSYPVLLQYF